MNWDEEYRRLNIEFRALEKKLSDCATLNAELVEALARIANWDRRYSLSWPDRIARAAIAKTKG